MTQNTPFNEPPGKATSEKLDFLTKVSFGVGDFGTAITANILVFSLSYFLTNVAGLPAGMAGNIRMIGGIWDAINDPVVGVLSDRTKSKLGRRYPWMLFGAIPLGVFFLLQWVVPQFSANPKTNQWQLFLFYIVVSILFNVAYTCVNLPYTALTPELTEDYNERTSLNSYRFAFSIGGSILSLILAQVIFSLVDDQFKRYLILGLVCSIIAIISPFICFLGTKDRVFANAAKEDYAEDQSSSLPYFEQLKIVFTNKPFLYVIGIFLCSWLAVQLTASIIPYFVVNWMGRPETTWPQVALAVQGTALLMLFVWSAVSKRYGKKAVYFMGMSVWIIAQAGLFFLDREQPIWYMYGLGIIAGFGVAVAYLVPWSMIPDVIDLDELNTGSRREGLFYGFMVLLQKIGLALGLFVVGQALELSGFKESVAGKPLPIQPESALFAIRLAIGPVPTIALIIGLALAYFYPITKEVHDEIMLKLNERKSSVSG